MPVRRGTSQTCHPPSHTKQIITRVHITGIPRHPQHRRQPRTPRRCSIRAPLTRIPSSSLDQARHFSAQQPAPSPGPFPLAPFPPHAARPRDGRPRPRPSASGQTSVPSRLISAPLRSPPPLPFPAQPSPPTSYRPRRPTFIRARLKGKNRGTRQSGSHGPPGVGPVVFLGTKTGAPRTEGSL